MSKFNVGDKVFHILYGWGTVAQINRNVSNPYIEIKLEDGVVVCSSLDGRLHYEDTVPIVFTYEEMRDHGCALFGMDLPKRKVKKWRWAVRYSNGGVEVTLTRHTEEQALSYVQDPECAWEEAEKITFTEIEEEE